jgi:hypothetical protein
MLSKPGKMAAKMNNKERMEWKGLQGKIDKLTKERDTLDSKLSNGVGDYEELAHSLKVLCIVTV